AYFNDNYGGIYLFEDSRGYLWLGDNAGVYRLKDGQVTQLTTREGVPPNTILRPFLEDHDGAIWFVSGYFGYTEKLGLVRYLNGQFSVWGPPAGLGNPDLGNVFMDREGTIWTS